MESLSKLTFLRIIMFYLICFVYYFIIFDGNSNLQRYFLFAAIAIFTVDQILLCAKDQEQWIHVVLTMDSLVAAGLGLVFPGTTGLYLTIFGIIGVTLFLAITDKQIIRRYVAFFLVIWAVIILYTYQATGKWQLAENVLNTGFVLFGSFVGSLIRKLMDARTTVNAQYEELNTSHAALKAAHDQLRLYSKQVEELTMIRERNHIAREIHDTVGHKITALLVQIQLAKEMMQLDLEKTKDVLRQCEQLTREMLQEIRLSVRTLHEDGEEQSMLQILRKLFQDYSKLTNLETTFEMDGDPASIPTTLQPTIIRIIQESLTNAKRHGQATQCSVMLNCQHENITVRIKDDGKGVPEVVPGFGLVNMRERILDHGGTLQFLSQADEGFEVIAEFPMKKLKWTAGVSQ